MKRDDIIKFVESKKRLTTADVAKEFGFSKVYAHRIFTQLIKKRQLIKVGSTRSAYYIVPDHYANLAKHLNVKLRLKNHDLKEHEVFVGLEKKIPALSQWDENVRSIFYYAFTEMLNNVIDHSQSKYVEIAVETDERTFRFHVDDFGIGVFRNIMKKRSLTSELEAVQDLLKGKTTTAPQAHSGEGIFFTSKIADVFCLESFGKKLTIDNKIQDIFLEEIPPKRGTKVTFSMSLESKKHLSDIFKQYQLDPEEPGFDKTEVHVRLYTMGTLYISRSQAKRVLVDLDKFKSVILDFDKVPTIGQAFADEIFRVFRTRYPEIKITPVNMNETVEFMVKRVAI